MQVSHSPTALSVSFDEPNLVSAAGLLRMSSTAYVRDVLSSRLITAILDSVFLFGYLAVIALQAPTFVVPVAILATLQILAISIFSPRLRMLSERELAEMSTSQSAMLETLNAVETIKSSGLEKNALERWRKTYKQQLAASVARRKYDAVATSVQGALSFGSPILLTIAGVNLVLNEGLSVGQAVAFVALGSAALSPVSTLGASLQALQTVRVHLDRLNDVMSEKPEDLNIKGTGILGPMRIELKNIVYSYSHNGTNVLKDINLTIKPGENIAIVGASGSGKSTLARIIIGLLRPEFGVLTINGEDISKVNLLSLRQSCGIVTQASEAVSGSIRSNILFGRSIGDEEVWRSLKVADLTKDIQNMPLGLNTPLGESGIGLSGGQLQRLAIARAVAAQPSVLVLDEATSHLDAATEARVVEQLASLGCTRIVIAHRLSTIRAASKVMLVENGEIVASGKHDDLLELANYREFFRNQITESVQQ